MAKVMLLVLAVGLVPLGVGAALIRHESAGRERDDLDAALTNEASAQAAALNEYFARARAIVLLTAQNPAFSDFYALPGTREEKLARGGPPLDRVNDALAYLEELYPVSIGEACFIDQSGAENARVVRGVRAPLGDLSQDEKQNPFFAPTIALDAGEAHQEVHQEKPYVSPDTGEWVISNSALIPTVDGTKPAMVHFEITVESFRREAAAGRFPLAIVDSQNGNVVLESRSPQRKGAPLGLPNDRRFVGLTGRAGRGVTTLDGDRIAYRGITISPHNANRWLVVTSAPQATGSVLAGNGLPLGLLAAFLLLIAVAVARRWVRVHANLDESQEYLRASEQRYRELFAQAEEARRALAVQNDRLLELDRLKDEFVALVSHELRTPLTSISGYLELLIQGDGQLTNDQKQFLTVIERNAERLLRLVGDLLFVAQVDANAFTLQLEEVDLAAIASSSVESARPVADEKRVSLFLSTDPLPPISGDRSRLAQLVDNLVSNALKFTPPGGRVSVRVAGVRGQALVLVSDDGIGIPEQEQARLFERFYRTSNAMTNAIAGTGLGLAISKAIAEAHEGEITFTSREGEGTTFRVAFPFQPAEREAVAELVPSTDGG